MLILVIYNIIMLQETVSLGSFHTCAQPESLRPGRWTVQSAKSFYGIYGYVYPLPAGASSYLDAHDCIRLT